MADHPTAPCDSLWLCTDACFLESIAASFALLSFPSKEFHSLRFFRVNAARSGCLRLNWRNGEGLPCPLWQQTQTLRRIDHWRGRWTYNKTAYIFYAYCIHCPVFRASQMKNSQFSGTRVLGSGESKKRIPGRRKCRWWYRRTGRSLCLRRSSTRRRLPSTLKRGKPMEESHLLSHLSWQQNPDQSMNIAFEHLT